MASEWVVGPFALSYALFLFIAMYGAWYLKMDLSWAILRYNRIFCNGEVLLFVRHNQ